MAPLLEARGVTVSRGGRQILRAASLSIGKGEAVAVQGPSGSGKSTLARVLATLVEPDQGEVLLSGVPARTLRPQEYRRRVAFLAQQPALFAGTVRDNLGAGPSLTGKALGEGEAQALLEAVGLPREMLAREARSLSGGEKQRVALGRALACAPEVLLLDEPTAALDPASGALVVELLRSLCQKGLSVVMVTHVEEHAQALGGRRLRCEGGEVLALP
jgi:putative ABC transport system ATP-binding protein